MNESQSLNLNDEELFLITELFIYNVGRGKHKTHAFPKRTAAAPSLSLWNDLRNARSLSLFLLKIDSI